MKKHQILITLTLSAAMILPGMRADAKKLSNSNEAVKLARNLVKGGTVVETDYGRDNGVAVYEVTLVKGGKKYNVEYAASNAKLLEYGWDIIAHKPSKGKVMSNKKVKSLALKKVKNGKITKVSYDASDREYDVDLKKGSKKYSLEYDAHSGKLIGYKWELISGNSKTPASLISIEKAKSIAQKKVPAGAKFIKVNLEKDDGRDVYEIEMKKGQMEYEMTIDAKTGKILDYEQDYDD